MLHSSKEKVSDRQWVSRLPAVQSPPQMTAWWRGTEDIQLISSFVLDAKKVLNVVSFFLIFFFLGN